MKKNKISKRIAGITDTHVKKENIDLCEDIFLQFFDFLKEKEVDLAVHLGDVFNERASQTLDTLMFVKKLKNTHDSLKIDGIYISGNHDKLDQNKPLSYLSLFSESELKHSKNFHPVDEYYFREIEKGVYLHFIPYFIEGKEYLKRLVQANKKCEEARVNILFTHISINGVKNNDGSLVDGDVEQHYFDCFDLVLVGHYHDRQQISDKIHYVGSAYQANFGENKDKGFFIINEDLSLEYFQTKFPEFKKIYIDAADPIAANRMLKLYGKKAVENNVRFIFKGTRDQKEKINFNKFKDAGIDCKFEDITTTVIADSVDEIKQETFDRKKFLKSWMQYCTGQSVNKQVMQKGLSLLKNLK